MSNCQTVGLANCLQAQTSEIEVVALDPGKFNKQRWRANARMAGFDRLLLYPAIRAEVPRAKLDRIVRHVALPIITFRGYHPDLIYLFNRGKPLSGPVSHYHSAIAFACFLQGIGPVDAQGYFTGAFYERCGYLGMWAGERNRLLAEFAAAGLDIGRYFAGWGRGTAFMYSYNHPRIRPIYDMASALLQAQGLSPRRSDLVPQDNLAGSAVFAVYPEIGEALGVQGQYEFRTGRDYRALDLTDYIARCHALYATMPAGDLEPFPEFRQQVEHIRTLL